MNKSNDQTELLLKAALTALTNCKNYSSSDNSGLQTPVDFNGAEFSGFEVIKLIEHTLYGLRTYMPFMDDSSTELQAKMIEHSNGDYIHIDEAAAWLKRQTPDHAVYTEDMANALLYATGRGPVGDKS